MLKCRLIALISLALGLAISTGELDAQSEQEKNSQTKQKRAANIAPNGVPDVQRKAMAVLKTLGAREVLRDDVKVVRLETFCSK